MKTPPLRLVTIAASAGGIPALQRVLSSLPADFPAAIAIVQHRTEHQPDLLAKVLGRSSRLPVRQAVSGDLMSSRQVYLAPAGHHLIVRENGTFGITDGRKIRHVRSSANPLFESAAQVVGPGVVAVVLTGGDSDATDGVQAVKAAGGTVIVQDEASSQCFSMPASAIRTGAVDYILPIEEIGPMLVKLAANHENGPTAESGFQSRRAASDAVKQR
jgi:two-component system, chemotaxis family, protein-glutamate methylesterase/glutaminase